ncbi:MAG: YceI family protein [Bdellovibrionaceae bacterium]|jgi:polyisoprenoid-binding protein YceI|nr:YceI family protein [Pseudobdellovibrionaceae bacterium]
MKTVISLLILVATSSAFASTLDLSKSSIHWSGSKITGDTHSGTLKIKSANVDTTLGKINSGEVVVDMNTLDNTDLKGKWKTKFLTHMKSADFLNLKKYPTASLKVTKLNRGYMFGTLTIMGKSNPVSMAYTKKGKTYEGELAFDRTLYNMKYGSGSFFKNLGDKTIDDTVILKVKMVLK